MYFCYEEDKKIRVPQPFCRTMMPYMVPETADCPIDFSVHITEWEPGNQVDEHCHDKAMEVMYCVSGHGTASVDGQVYDLVPNSMIAAAAGQMHCIRNTGSETLRCLCIFSPPTTGEALRSRAMESVEAAREQGETTAAEE